MITNIYNEFLTVIKSTLTDCRVMGTYPIVSPSFPLVIMTETANDTHIDTVDTSGEKHNDIIITFEIFSDAEDKLNIVRDIRNRVDAIMADTYQLNRSIIGDVTNYADPNVYRYIVRYSGVVDSTNKINRR